MAPDGPCLPSFEPLGLATAIEHECNRVAGLQNQKISIHMDTQDARLLVNFLRYRSLA